MLERAGIVRGHRHGRGVRYSVDAERLRRASQCMAGVAEQWDARLSAIKRIAEGVALSHEDMPGLRRP
ncbi:hypothetical protein [Phytohabitans kaempferiae]|uniref:HTH arsR-type domain-containing protein n=1 Tax=Phytohabitans kaempferiae TaxID=1620943 RepID=A0ABV6M1U4_9ACTN